MILIKAIIMGILQGLTEFLPVSSSGHLAIMGQLLKLQLDDGAFFDILLHFGTLTAVFIVFRKDILALIIDGLTIVKDFFVINFLRLRKKSNGKKVIDTNNKKFVMLIIVSSIPTTIIAFALKAFIADSFNNLIVPGIGLLFTATLLYATKFIKEGEKDASNTGYVRALIIGTAQGIATIPGISRSGSTLVTSLLLKLDREFAIKYSFIMSIPVILGATVVTSLDVDFSTITGSLLVAYLIGTICAAVVGYICIKTLLVLIKKNKLHYFAYYCFAVGILAITGYFMI